MSCLDLGKQLGVERAHSKRGPFQISCSVEQRPTLPHGAVNEVHLMMDRMTGKSRGFAFVTMNDHAQANAAKSALNGRELNGRALTVNEARPREERPRPYGGRRPFAGNRR